MILVSIWHQGFSQYLHWLPGMKVGCINSPPDLHDMLSIPFHCFPNSLRFLKCQIPRVWRACIPSVFAFLWCLLFLL